MKAIAREPELETRRAVTARPGDEINLAEYAAVSWRYRWVILAAVALAAIVTFVVNKQITPTYEVTVRLLATESRVIDDPTSRAISVARFRELLESPSLVATVLQEFNLTSPPHKLTPRRFLANNLSVSEIPDTGILRASIRLTDPVLLVKLSNGYAKSAVNLAGRLNAEETDYARDSIKAQVDKAKTRLTEAEGALEAFRKKTQIELLRTDVESILDHRPDVMALQVDIETERAQLRQAEIELSQQERVRDVRRSLDSLPDTPIPPKPVDPNVTAERDESPVSNRPFTPGVDPSKPRVGDTSGSSRGTSGRRESTASRGTAPTSASREKPDTREPVRTPPPAPHVGLPLRAELNDPYVNPVYEVLARDVAQSRARLAGLQSRRQQLVSELRLASPTNAKLDALYRAETELAHLTGEYEVARAAYLNASSKYEEARLQVTVRSPRLQILDGALPPERPVAPRVLRNVASAMLLALTLGVVGVLLFDSSRQRRALP